MKRNKIEIADKLYDELSKEITNKNDIDREFLKSNIFELKEEMSVLANNLSDDERRERAERVILELRNSKNYSHLEHRVIKETMKRRRKRILAGVGSIAATILLYFLVPYFDTDNNTPIISDVAQVVSMDMPIITNEIGQEYNITSDYIGVEGYTIKMVGNTISINSPKNGLDVAENNIVKYNEIRIPKHGNYVLTLSDGSVVTLNAGSRLRYPINNYGTIRECHLDGEGYFKIAKSDKPFIVKSGDISVKVYGTEFNVKVQREKVETLLITGSVSVTANNEDEYMIKPNQLATYKAESGGIKIKDVEVSHYLSWMNNCFKYVDTPLMDVLYDLQRWYGIEYAPLPDNLKDVKVTLFSLREVSVVDMNILLVDATGLNIMEKGGVYVIE